MGSNGARGNLCRFDQRKTPAEAQLLHKAEEPGAHFLAEELAAESTQLLSQCLGLSPKLSVDALLSLSGSNSSGVGLRAMAKRSISLRH